MNFSRPSRALADLLVQALGFPAREDRRLLLRQAGLHRKVGPRQEDGRAVVGLGRLGGVGHWRAALAVTHQIANSRDLVECEQVPAPSLRPFAHMGRSAARFASNLFFSSRI